MGGWRQFPVPNAYDATPASLRDVKRRLTADGLFCEHELREDDLNESVMREIVRILLRYFADRELDDWYRVEFVRREQVPVMTGVYEDGFQTGPFCFIPIGHPLAMLTTAFHEVGHAMFPAQDVNAREVAAVYVAHLFAEKVITERPHLAAMRKLLSSSLDDTTARDLLRSHATPEAMFPGHYSAEHVRSHAMGRAMLEVGSKLEVWFEGEPETTPSRK